MTTYAHELQHFVQHGHTPTLSAVNLVLYRNLKDFEPNIIAIDIPHEREANIVSKRVAERIFGVDAVREYAEGQIQFMEGGGAMEQKARWVFFRDVPSATVYNLLHETIPLVACRSENVSMTHEEFNTVLLACTLILRTQTAFNRPPSNVISATGH